MSFLRRGVPALIWILLGCRSVVPPERVEPGGGITTPTGIEGTVYRTPTRPVCQVDSPCNTPFSAGFEVWQNERLVTRFQSDSDGHFLVHLDPGRYTVALDSTAGILMRSQVQEVTVGSDGLTRVTWEFDTGIR